MKKVISLFLAVLMFVTMFPLSAFAENGDGYTTETQQEISYNASNALGEVLADAMNESESEAEKDNFCFIQSVEINGLEAEVVLSAEDASTVVVSVYDEETNVMVTSGKTQVDSETETVTVELAECEMPEYFIIKAFLLNSENEPLCKSYESLHYTKAFEEFFEKTVFDFDEEKVINLDYGYDSNFAVVSDDAKVTEQTEGENILTTNDYDNGIYVFENANEEITSLKEGDVLYFVYGDGAEDYILTKVGTIKNNKGTVTITTADEYEISDFFSYIKIDSDKMQNEQPQTFAMARGFDDDKGDEKETKKYEIEAFSIQFKNGDRPDSDKKVEADADVDYDITLSCIGSFVENYVKFYYDIRLFGKDAYEFEYTVTASFNFELKIDVYGMVGVTFYPLKEVAIPILPALDIKITIKITFSLSAHVAATGKLGFEVSRGVQRKYDKKKDVDYERILEPKIVPIIEFTGSVSIQFEVSPAIEVGFKILKVFAASVGVEGKITTKLTLVEAVVDGMEKLGDKFHPCNVCFKIESTIGISIYFKITFNITKNPEKEKVIVQINLLNRTVPIGEYHLSLYDGKWMFEKGECDNWQYKVIFKVLGESNEPLENVIIKVDGKDVLKTDSNGNAVKYYKNKTYSCTAELDGYRINKEKMIFYPIYFAVYDSAQTVTIYMEKGKPDEEPDDTFPEMPEIPDGDSGNTSGIISKGECGDSGNVRWTLYNDGELFISGDGDMSDYTFTKAPWYSDKKTVKTVVIDDGVTSVGNSAFYDCDNIVDFEFGKDVAEIGYYAFGYCDGLTDIIIPESVTTISDYAFSYCESLSTVEMKNNVTSIGDNAFSYCENLSFVKLSSNVSEICANAFFDCSSLATIENCTGVEKVGERAFAGCSKLTGVEFSEKLTEIGIGAFAYCSSMTHFNIPGKVNSIGNEAFSFCSGLEDITIPDSVVESGNLAFYKCDNLKTVIIGNGLSKINSGSFAFCENLSTVVIPESVTTVEVSAFFNCIGLTNVYYSGSPEEWKSIIFQQNNDVIADSDVVCNYVSTEKLYLAEKGNANEIATKLLDAIIGNEYVMLVVRDENSDDLLSSDNLLYIDQKEAEAEELVFSFYLDEGITDYKVLYFNANINEVPHTHEYTAVETAPTCTEKGYTTYTCTCGDTYVDNYVDPIGHIIEVGCGKAPTCTEIGYTDSQVCVECGEVLVAQKEIPATGHTPGPWEVVIEAQVGEDGLEQQECNVCKVVLNERIIPALPEQTTKPIEKPTNKIGDANGDGKITAADARITLRISAKLEKIESYKLPLSVFDATGDGKITAADARKILRVSAKLETM